MTIFTIIGAGRIGTALAQLDPSARLIRRNENWQHSLCEGPILICTRNADLVGLIESTPAHRRADLIFIQNGMIHSLLEQYGLTENTQAQFYFAVKHIGAPIEDGGGTALMGKWAPELSKLLLKGSIEHQVLSIDAYRKVMAEKFLWICINGVLCSAYDLSVGELASQKRSEIDELYREFQPILENEINIVLEKGGSDRLVEYSLQIPAFFTGLKEWPWRNGWLWQRKQTPLHRHLLPDSFKNG